ncbi:MAG: aminoacyl-tRNA hydrolase [Candidatus Omnitrophica bacterium]|nr:aminoacyl-tRNA hydrolase [Candidatus Omnitrophota bacterium]
MASGATYLIVGLGNPGSKYDSTRHNVGKKVVQRLARELKGKFNRRAGAMQTAEVFCEDARVVLGIPDAFMNESGQAVADLVKRHPVPLDRLLVIFDDVALPLGNIRVRPRGSDGGHRGIRSIIGLLQDDGFARLRIGIGSKEVPQALDQYVLAPFSRQEQKLLAQTLDGAVAVCRVWMRQGIEAAMNRSNRKVS